MRQSVTRSAFPLLIAALSAALVIVLIAPSVWAAGPPGETEGPVKPAGAPHLPSFETTEVVTVDVPVDETVVQLSDDPAFANSDVLMSSTIKCKRTTVTRKHNVGPSYMYKLVSWTEWCYDGTHIARGHPEFDHTWKTGISPAPGTFIKNRGSGDKKLGGGLGQTYHKDKAWGKYQVCRPNPSPPYNPNCNPVEKIEVKKTQYGNGDYKPKS